MSQEIDLIIAKIQSKVGEFLLCREKLTKLVNHPDIIIKVDADSLLSDQNTLEVDLNQALAKIDQIKAGNWTLSDISDLGQFAYSLNQHIENTDKLVKKAQGIPEEEEDNISKYLVWGGIGLVMFILAKKLLLE
jgi:uncharacterized protein YoxC